MHTYQSENGTLFHFNQDIIGSNVMIGDLLVNGEDLVEFIMVNYLLAKKIAKLEQTDWRDLE